jgi:hypothetical protein
MGIFSKRQPKPANPEKTFPEALSLAIDAAHKGGLTPHQIASCLEGKSGSIRRFIEQERERRNYRTSGIHDHSFNLDNSGA